MAVSKKRKATALLVAALDESGASDRMKLKAQGGHYHDFDTSTPTPITDLVRDAQGEGLDALAARDIAGEFDGW